MRGRLTRRATLVVALAVGGVTPAGARLAGLRPARGLHDIAPIAAVAEPAAEAQKLDVAPGETLASALVRTGVSPGEAAAAVSALSESVDTVNLSRDLSLDLRLGRSADRSSARLVELSLHPTPGRRVRLSRGADDRFIVESEGVIAPTDRAKGGVTVVQTRDNVVQGPMEQVLYGGAAEAGATPSVVARAVRLFAHKLDLARDLRLGDRVRLVVARPVDADGRFTTAEGTLIYAELSGSGRVVRFYLHQEDGSAKAEFVDEGGGDLSSELLRTPVDNPRVTSGFGMRLHPLLGYTRMHRGVDFGAGVGTPVVAAGDGVVEQVRWAGGYGRWIRLQHAGGWETGYGHLSAWAAGLKSGETVRQGQVIGYVGSSGLSTGPHLHYELYRNGEAIDPGGVRPRIRTASLRTPQRFASERRRIDAVLAGAGRVASAAPISPSDAGAMN